MIEIILDASQIELFEKCPRAWYYAYVMNLEPKRSRKSFDVGSYFHKVLEYYYSNPDKYKEMRDRQRAALTFARLPSTREQYGIDQIEIKEYEPGFMIKRLQHYFIRWEDEDEHTETVAVEKGFSQLLYEDGTRRYILEGKIDHIAYRQNLGMIVEDHKTQSRAGERYPSNHQLFNYFNAVKPEYFVYNYIGLQQEPNKDTFKRTIYRPHPGMIEQWMSDVINTFEQMNFYKNMVKEDSFIREDEIITINKERLYPRRRSGCDGKYGLCQYHKICEVPDDSRFKLAVIDSYKEKDEKWRAWS